VIVMGLDLSLTGTGLVVWDAEAQQVRAAHLFGTLPKDGHRIARADVIASFVTRHYGHLRPELVGLEDYAHGTKTNQSTLGELGAIVKLRLWEAGYEPERLSMQTASHVKLFATGRGRHEKWEGKMPMIEAAEPFLLAAGVPSRLRDDDNVCDALHVARSAYQDYVSPPVPKVRRPRRRAKK
jgi:hypothetical protein